MRVSWCFAGHSPRVIMLDLLIIVDYDRRLLICGGIGSVDGFGFAFVTLRGVISSCSQYL